MATQLTERTTRPLEGEVRRVIVDAFARALLADLRASVALADQEAGGESRDPSLSAGRDVRPVGR